MKQFGSVAELYERLGEVKSEKLRAALRLSAEVVVRNGQMVRLRDDLPCEFSAAELTVKSADAAQLRELFGRWGFRGMLASLEEEMPHERQKFLI